MTNLKLSSKMHIMIAVTAVIIALGIAVGLVCQFVSNGYFNYGADYSSYNCVSVNYAIVDYAHISHNPDEEVEDAVRNICDKAFKSAGVNYYSSTSGSATDGGELTFKFSKSVDKTKIQTAVDAIQKDLTDPDDAVNLSFATLHEVQTELGSGTALMFGAIALASAVVFQFIYFAVRYKLTAAFAALLADVHNLAIFVSLLTITRIPVGSTVFALAAVTVLMTMIGCCYLFDKLRNGAKDENFAKLGTDEQVDACANENFVDALIPAVCVVASAVLLFLLMAISALSVGLILTVAVGGLLTAVASVYGTVFFVPSVYPRFKKISDNFKTKHSKKVKNS